MPIGRVKWFDPDKGFGFVTNPGDDDVFVGTQVLPDGVEELHQGQKIEYEFAAGRKGPQVLRITDIRIRVGLGDVLPTSTSQISCKV